VYGKKVAVLENTIKGPGFYAKSWNGKDNLGRALPTGFYILRIQAGKFQKKLKVMLVK